MQFITQLGEITPPTIAKFVHLFDDCVDQFDAICKTIFSFSIDLVDFIGHVGSSISYVARGNFPSGSHSSESLISA